MRKNNFATIKDLNEAERVKSLLAKTGVTFGGGGNTNNLVINGVSHGAVNTIGAAADGSNPAPLKNRLGGEKLGGAAHVPEPEPATKPVEDVIAPVASKGYALGGVRGFSRLLGNTPPPKKVDEKVNEVNGLESASAAEVVEVIQASQPPHNPDESDLAGALHSLPTLTE